MTDVIGTRTRALAMPKNSPAYSTPNVVMLFRNADPPKDQDEKIARAIRQHEKHCIAIKATETPRMMFSRPAATHTHDIRMHTNEVRYRNRAALTFAKRNSTTTTTQITSPESDRIASTTGLSAQTYESAVVPHDADGKAEKEHAYDIAQFELSTLRGHWPLRFLRRRLRGKSFKRKQRRAGNERARHHREHENAFAKKREDQTQRERKRKCRSNLGKRTETVPLETYPTKK